jgi:succinate-semialdehyde dehydrogenase/glutarate-semialdehyde dehydrogenase
MQFQTINPATEEAGEAYELLTDDALQQRIEHADQTFREWRKTSFAERSRLFYQLIAQMEQHKETYAQTITREMGKPIQQARRELDKSAWVCRYYADNAESFLSDQHRDLDKTRDSYVRFAPVGALYVIMPWNFPFWQLFRFAAPALMAGNTLLFKHAPNVPASARHIASLFHEAGFPEGAFQNLFIDYEQSDQLIAHPAVQGVTLTGSKGAGSHVAQQAGAHVKKSVLELGGSDPYIVLPDADVGQAAETAALARLQNTGQSCIASKRFIVSQPVADDFIDQFQQAFRTFQTGHPAEEATSLGPLARSDIREALDGQVQQAIAQGAKLVTGGKPLEGPGFYYEPTILTGIQPGTRMYKEEVFGPAAGVYVVKDEQEAIQLANDTEFGLGAAIWSEDHERAQTVADEIYTGTIAINGLVKSDPRLPFGGVKASGYGRELSEFGIKEFVNIKTVNIF